MKGGVGKTTIAAHVFRHLYMQLKKSVLLVDFDPQFNLTQTVIAQASYEKTKAARKTIFSVMEDHAEPSIFKISSKLGPPPDLGAVTVVLRNFVSNPEISLSLVPGDFDMVKYSLIGESKLLQPIKDRFLTFIEDARTKRDLICIDCNPSSSFMTVCALQASAFNEREIRDFARTLSRRDVRQFVADVLSSREALDTMNTDSEQKPINSLPEIPSEVDAKIERLLLSEAGLSKMRAIELLTRELSAKYPKTIIPPESRKGFSSWIRKLASLGGTHYVAIGLRAANNRNFGFY